MRYNVVLTIAGSDSGGGAGIQADIKTISACGCYAATAITAITAQNTLGVTDIHPVPIKIIEAQIDAVMSDIGANVIKIGMLHSAEVIEVVVRAIDKYKPRHVVLDPVMVSTSGHRLIEESAIEMLSRELIPRATIITPNIPEAEILAGHEIKDQSTFPDVAKELSRGDKVAVLLKAGHLPDQTLTDIFYNTDGQIFSLRSQRVDTKNTHGTGCTLSSAIAAFLAQGLEPTQAVSAAKNYLISALTSGAQFEIGKGHGPVDHLYAQRRG